MWIHTQYLLWEYILKLKFELSNINKYRSKLRPVNMSLFSKSGLQSSKYTEMKNSHTKD